MRHSTSRTWRHLHGTCITMIYAQQHDRVSVRLHANANGVGHRAQVNLGCISGMSHDQRTRRRWYDSRQNPCYECMQPGGQKCKNVPQAHPTSPHFARTSPGRMHRPMPHRPHHAARTHHGCFPQLPRELATRLRSYNGCSFWSQLKDRRCRPLFLTTMR